MLATRLDHVTLRCADLARSRAFYVDLLGLTDGPRPPFDFEGAWLYLAGAPVVHLAQRMAGSPAGGTGAFDHFAFAGSDIEAARSRLNAAGASFAEADVPGRSLRQIFLRDPDGVKVEITFGLPD